MQVNPLSDLGTFCCHMECLAAFGSFVVVSFYYLFVHLICLFVVLCFSKEILLSHPRRKRTCLGLLLYVFSSLIKRSPRSRPCYILFCASSGKMVIQKTKKYFLFFNVCIIIIFIYLSKSCINKPVEHFNPVLSLKL